MTGKRKNTREGTGNCGSVSEEDKEDRNGSQENILCCKERGKFMSERENLPRIERQLRLYEMVCQYVIVQFSDVCEKKILIMNCFLACRSGRGRGILRCCEVLGMMFPTMRWNIVFIRTIITIFFSTRRLKVKYRAVGK